MIGSLTIFADWLSSDIMIEHHTKARCHRCFHVAVFSLRRAICKIDCDIGIEVGAGKPELLRTRRMEEAWALQKTGIKMTKLFTSDGPTPYPSTKAVMNHLAIPRGGSLRPPLRPLSGEALTVLTADMDRLLVAGTTQNEQE